MNTDSENQASLPPVRPHGDNVSPPADGSPGAPPPPPPAPSPKWEPDYMTKPASWGELFAPLKSFFGLGGSILYCLSALAILYGIVQIIDPLLAHSRVYAERLACVGALNLYECALLAVMLVIVLWRRVTDDAVSLLVLIAIFLVANAVTLDQVVMDNSPIACAIGAGCFALAVVKLWIMRRYIALRLDRGLLAGVVLLLAWNFLMSPALAMVTAHCAKGTEILRSVWQAGWLVMLAGGACFYLQAARGAALPDHAGKAAAPFLQTPGMAWIFAGILYVIGGFHQYELVYIFDLPSAFGDYLPLITLGCLIVLELPRMYGRNPRRFEVAVSAVPLALIGAALFGKAFVVESPWGLGFFWHPTVLLAAAAAAVLRAGIARRHTGLIVLSLAYTLLILLTAGVACDGPEQFHWRITVFMLALALSAYGMVFGKLGEAVLGLFILAMSSPWWGNVSVENSRPMLLAAVGLGPIILSFRFKRIPKEFVWIGAILLSIGAWMLGHGELWRLVVGGAAAAAVGALIAFLRPNWPATIILLLPAAAALVKAIRPLAGKAAVAAVRIMPDQLTGWHYVILSFILLAAGMWVSLRKGRRHSDHPSDSSDAAGGKRDD